MSVKLIVQNIADKLRGRHLFAIFDRDGTLVPINPDPSAAILQEHIRNLLLDLNSLPNTEVAILSARGIEGLDKDFSIHNLTLAGNYGMEVLLPNKKYFAQSIATQYKDRVLQAKVELQQRLPKETLTVLEDDQLTLCLHWHLTPEEHIEKVHSIIKELKTQLPELVFVKLRTSYEVWPPLKWNKANGLEQMISMLETNLDKSVILYIGDSDSDEPAFEWVNNHQGISVRVGKDAKSIAQFEINSPKEVEEILKMLIIHMNNC